MLALFADLHRELLAVKPLDLQEALAEAAAQGPEALEATQEECEAVLMQVRHLLSLRTLGRSKQAGSCNCN